MTKIWRLNLIFVFFILFSAVLICRLFYLQVRQGDFYKVLAQGIQGFSNETSQERGQIFFQDSQVLAINENWPLVFVNPKKIKEPENLIQKLAVILDLKEDFLKEKFSQDKLYVPIKSKLSQEEVEEIKKLKLDGLHLDQNLGRYYPKEYLASQVVGFLGAQGQGQYGLEGYYNDELKNGQDLCLTIDYNIQFQAEKLLAGAEENLHIEAGQIIVIEPETGRILALANFPNFNPNQYQDYAQKDNLEIFKNRATQDFFEPGSVFKPITMAAALNEGKITPETGYLDKGIVKIHGCTIYNYEHRIHDWQTMTQVLEKSINTGAVFAEGQIGHRLFLDYIDKFGIFEPTGIDLTESYSENKELYKGYEINFATASFGQGIEMTPIQLVRAYCAIANGGKLVRPYLVEGAEHKPQHSQVISSKTSRQLTDMLVNVVKQGFARAAQVPGYFIAGKTGTAQVPEKGVYSPDKSWQTFVGFGPAFSPRFLILVKLDNPQTKTAEYSAVPLFHDLAEYIIHYLQIPPDYE